MRRRDRESTDAALYIFLLSSSVLISSFPTFASAFRSAPTRSQFTYFPVLYSATSNVGHFFIFLLLALFSLSLPPTSSLASGALFLLFFLFLPHGLLSFEIVVMIRWLSGLDDQRLVSVTRPWGTPNEDVGATRCGSDSVKSLEAGTKWCLPIAADEKPAIDVGKQKVEARSKESARNGKVDTMVKKYVIETSVLEAEARSKDDVRICEVNAMVKKEVVRNDDILDVYQQSYRRLKKNYRMTHTCLLV